MNPLKIYFRDYGEKFLREEMNNNFKHLKKINYPRLRNGLSFLETLTSEQKEEFIKNTTIGNSKNDLVRKFKDFTMVEITPTVKFKDNKKLLKKIASDCEFLDFYHDGEGSFAHYHIGKFRVTSSVISNNRSCNIECRHSINHLEKDYFGGPHSLMQMANIYHGDFWNNENLDFDQTYEEVTSVLRKSYELLKEPLESFDDALVPPKPEPKHKNEQDWAKSILGQFDSMSKIHKTSKNDSNKTDIELLFKSIASGEMSVDLDRAKILDKLRKIVIDNPYDDDK